MDKGKKWSIGSLIAGVTGALFVVAAACMIIVLNREMKKDALAEAKTQALIILDRNLAIHSYFNKQLKPALFPVLDSETAKGYFEPAWMSSTYAVREINKHSKALSENNYYYKECAINARSPENEADPYERAFIERLNRDPAVMEDSAVRTIAGKSYYALLRRGESMEAACLRCHSTADVAPSGLTRHYGGERSFGRQQGEVVSAVSIRVPVATAFAHANRISLNLSLFLVLVLASLYALLLWLNKRLLFAPLRLVSHKAEQLAAGAASLTEVIPLPGGRELREFVASFNTMTAKLAAAHAELVANNELLDKIFSTTQVQLAYLDRDFRFVRVNEAYAAACGRQTEDFLGKDFFALFPSPGCEAIARQVVAAGQAYTAFADPFGWQDNSRSYWDWTLQPILDGAGKTEGLFFVCKDVSERKRAEEALSLSDARLAEAQRLARLGSWEWDIAGNRLWWSDETFRIFGIDPEAFGATFEAFIGAVHPDDRGPVREAIAQALERDEGGWRLDYRILLPDGGIRFVHEEGRTEFDPAGRPVKRLGSVQDVTEQHQVEMILQEAAQNLNEAQRLAHLGSWELDLRNNVLTWSDEIYRMFEIDPARFGATYEAFLDAIHPDDREAVNLAYTNSLKTRQAYAIEHRLLCADGRVKYVHEQCETDYDNGTPLRSRGTVQDITGRKLAEEEIRQHLARQKALLDMYQQMAAAPVREIIAFVVDRCVNLTGSALGFVGLISDDDQHMEAHIWSETVMTNCPLDKPLLFPISEAGLWAEPIRQRRIVIVNDYRQPHPGKKGYPAGHLELVRFMGVPVLDKGRVVAVAAVANRREDYAATDHDRVALFLEGMWDLIKRKRAEEELRALNDELEARVAQRTAELAAKNEELERTNKLFVGRELRMIELKEKIRRLEKAAPER